MKKIVIIGSGAASERALKEIIRENVDTFLVVIGKEKNAPYPRPRLPELIEGKLDDSAFFPDALEKYREKNFLFINDVAVKIDRDKKTVVLKSAKSISYDRLIIATGSEAFIPDIDGVSQDHVHVLRSYSDAVRIKKDLSSSSYPVVLGAGVLGIEAALAIKKRRGVNVRLIESAGYILSRQLDEKASAFLEKRLENLGLSFIKNVSIKSIKEKSIVLSDGNEMDSDFLLLSCGVRSSVSLAKDAGLEVNRAIVINSNAQTSDKDIFACGDCAEYNALCPSLISFANESARVASLSALSIKAEMNYESPVFSMLVPSASVFTVGKMTDNVVRKEDEESLVSYYLSDSKILGISAINRQSMMMSASKMIGTEYREENE